MSVGISRRLQWLERVALQEKPCPECGFVPSASLEQFEVSWPYEADEPRGPEFCPECGQQTGYVVMWGDLW